jgi:hypothetical protein
MLKGHVGEAALSNTSTIDGEAAATD